MVNFMSYRQFPQSEPFNDWNYIPNINQDTSGLYPFPFYSQISYFMINPAKLSDSTIDTRNFIRADPKRWLEDLKKSLTISDINLETKLLFDFQLLRFLSLTTRRIKDYFEDVFERFELSLNIRKDPEVDDWENIVLSINIPDNPKIDFLAIWKTIDMQISQLHPIPPDFYTELKVGYPIEQSKIHRLRDTAYESSTAIS